MSRDLLPSKKIREAIKMDTYDVERSDVSSYIFLKCSSQKYFYMTQMSDKVVQVRNDGSIVLVT